MIFVFYDAARRLIGITDRLGNRIDYTLDPQGNTVRPAMRMTTWATF